MDNRMAFNILCLAVLLLSFFASPSNAQKFNAFKSYKDAAVKPANYGRVQRRNFPIEEYLSGNQMKMMMARRGKDRPEDTFDNNWSGFKQYKDNRAAGKALPTSSLSNSNDFNWRRRLMGETTSDSSSSSTGGGSGSIATLLLSHLSESLHWYLLVMVLSTFAMLCYTIKSMLYDQQQQQKLTGSKIEAFNADRFANMSIRQSRGSTLLTV